MNGYDAVAYFTDNAAVEGNKQFRYDWQGTTWLFKSQGNLDTFKSAPEKIRSAIWWILCIRRE
ncbi:MAG: YHS domain-containing protein [Bacteroidota bacterium]